MSTNESLNNNFSSRTVELPPDYVDALEANLDGLYQEGTAINVLNKGIHFAGSPEDAVIRARAYARLISDTMHGSGIRARVQERKTEGALAYFVDSNAGQDKGVTSEEVIGGSIHDFYRNLEKLGIDTSELPINPFQAEHDAFLKKRAEEMRVRRNATIGAFERAPI